MSVELDAWAAFKTACTGSVTLAAYVKTFKFYRTAEQFQPAQHPVLMAWVDSIPNDNYFEFPKRKKVELKIILNGLIMQTGNSLEDELLHYDALIKNAAETDITLGGKAIITNIGASGFHGLSEGVVLVQIPAIITLPIITAGNR